ncbi:hypothetical protein AEP_01728 [Curvibacter sp. AEP1-3]|uniref:hypothetical protein n=1 Tax=Curvibacter sp. AEP1-3 TaxID=1844971 RepID=UPI000B3BE5A9|nr:hypothetical protein [Curvibacter sp. AEP1-3]ARV18672.1 hypothetical protein AEP_01728 [Curvibacter sp. AEP1-3]
MAEADNSNLGDLSDGDLRADVSKSVDLGLEEQKHRFSTEQTLFSSAIGFAVLLYMTAIVMGAVLVFSLQKDPKIHWHVSLLIASFIVPPTVIMVSLIRAVYKKPEKASSKDETQESALPTLDLVKDFAKEVSKEMAKEVAKLTKH